MTSKNKHTLRAVLQAVIALVMVFSAAASVSTASAATIPVSDEFTTAPKMTASYSASISDMTLATTDGGFDPPLTCDGGSVGEASLWYTYTAASSGEAVISTNGSAYDTVLTLWKADTLGNLIEVGCNDDAHALTTTSAMTIAIRGGIKYYVEVTRKTGAAVTPPDKLVLSFKFAGKVAAPPKPLAPFFYDASEPGFIYYSPRGWQVFPVLGAYNGAIHIGNNPGDSATFFFDGSYVQICYATGPQFDDMTVTIDGIQVATIGQYSAGNGYACWDTPFVPIPGSASILDDNVHKLVLKNAGGGKVNIDTLQVFPHFDFWPPDPIFDLTATTGTATGRVTLKWTATGDDGTFGRVARNEIRYRTDSFFTNVCPADWNSANVYSLSQPAPVMAGLPQTVTLSGLAPGVTYYFMVVGVDEAGNYGDPCASSEASAVAKAPTPVGPGFYDDKSAYWAYSGSWTVLNDSESLNNSLHQASKIGSTAAIFFTGTQFRLAYWATPAMGLVDVYLDGAYLTTIDQSTSVGHQRIYVSPVMINGPHSVMFVQQSLPYINIDGIYIGATTDGGPPDPINDLVATQGGTLGTVDLTWTATGDDPGGVGTATTYEVRASTTGPILTEYDWELAKPVGGVTPMPQVAGTPEGMTVTGLVPGLEYWFAIRATDDAFYSVLSNTDSDPAGLGGYAYQPAGFYENTDLFAWYYAGIWTEYFNVSASTGSQHQCNYSGNTATFLFNGTGFTLTYQSKSGFTGLGVYVDGVKIGSINQKSTFIQWQRTVTFSGFGAGNHVVQFTCNGPANIDAIEILP